MSCDNSPNFVAMTKAVSVREGHGIVDRPAERLLPFLVLIAAIGAISRKVPRQFKIVGLAARYVSYVLLAALAAGWEKPRWQQFPAALGSLLLALSHRGNRAVTALTAAANATAAFILCQSFPVVKLGLVKKESPFGVGVFDYEYTPRCTQDEPVLPTAPRGIGRCFYPTAKAEESSRNRMPYLYRQAPGALQSSYVKAELPKDVRSKLPLESVFRCWHCNSMAAKHGASLVPSPDSESKLPVIVFSHGLKACRELYSAFALRLASLGCVVFCLEHLDGSAASARFSDGTTHDDAADEAGRGHAQMKILKDNSSEEDYNAARMEQTKIRVTDVRTTIRFVKHINTVGAGENDVVHIDKLLGAVPKDLLDQFRDRLDLSTLILAGHSFGGGTALTYLAEEFHHFQAQQQLQDRNLGSPALEKFRSEVTAALVFDPAMCWIPKEHWPLFGYIEGVTREELKTLPMPATMPRPPTLAIFSQEWFDKGWFWPLVRRYLHVYADDSADGAARSGKRKSSASKHKLVALRGSTHVSLSDMGLLFPSWLGKFFGDVLSNTAHTDQFP
mgnify:CR=1 FL=1